MENEETGGIGWWEGCLGRCRPSGPKADVARDAVSVGEAVVRVLERIEAHLGSAPKERASVLASGFTNAAASGLKIPLFALDTDERLAHLDSGNTSRSATHEGVEDRLILRSVADAPLHDFERLLRGMIPALRALFTKHSVPHVADQANGFRKIGPCQFAISEITSVHLVPYQPTLGCRAIVIVAAKDDLPASSRANLRHNFGINRRVVPIVISVVDGDCQLTARLGLSCSLTDPIRRISADQIDLAERRQHLPAIAQIQRGASDGFNAGHSERPHSISPGLREAEDHFTRSAGFDGPVELCFQLAGRVQARPCDDHRMTHRQFGKSALAFGEAGEAHHSSGSPKKKPSSVSYPQGAVASSHMTAKADSASMMAIAIMVSLPELQAACLWSDQKFAGSCTACFAARLASA